VAGARLGVFLYFCRTPDNASICGCGTMPDQFAEVVRQLEEVLPELNQVRDPTLRRGMLSQMRLLIVEADRLVGD